MSFQASSWVIKHSKHKGSALLLMLMIANHAHADGTNAFPSIKTLAEECRMSSRQVIRLITMLEESGELIVERSVGRTAHNYSVNMELNPDKMSPLNPDKLSLLKDPNPDKSNIPTLTNPTLNPDMAMSYKYKEESFKDLKEEEEEATSAPPQKNQRSKKSLKTRPDLSDEDWIVWLKDQPENKGIAVTVLFRRMLKWCAENDETPSRKRLLVWLAKERDDVPVSYSPPKESNGWAAVGKYVPPNDPEPDESSLEPCAVCGKDICFMLHSKAI